MCGTPIGATQDHRGEIQLVGCHADVLVCAGAIQGESEEITPLFHLGMNKQNGEKRGEILRNRRAH